MEFYLKMSCFWYSGELKSQLIKENFNILKDGLVN
jgi:hypothetical protein